MQLIVATEAHTDIETKMCDIDQGHLNDKEIFNNATRDVKIQNTSNGNKENIEIQDNIITDETNKTQNEKTDVDESTEKLDSNVALDENTAPKENESTKAVVPIDASHKDIKQDEYDNDISLDSGHPLNDIQPTKSENSTVSNETSSTETSTNTKDEKSNQKKKTLDMEPEIEEKEKDNVYKMIEEALSVMEGISKKGDSGKETTDENNSHFDNETNKENDDVLNLKKCDDTEKHIANVDPGRGKKMKEDNSIENLHVNSKSQDCIIIQSQEAKNNKNVLENLEKEEESKEVLKLEDKVREFSEYCTEVNNKKTDNSEIRDTQMNDEVKDIVEIEKLSDKNHDITFEKKVDNDNGDHILENQGIEESETVITLRDKLNVKPKENESQSEIVNLDEESDVRENSFVPKEKGELKTSAELKLSEKSIIECVDITETDTSVDKNQLSGVSTDVKDDVMDVDEVTIIDDKKEESVQTSREASDQKKSASKINPLCKLDNTMDILSDDEDEPPPTKDAVTNSNDKQCINIEDDDDVMLIDEDVVNKTVTEKENKESESAKSDNIPKAEPFEAEDFQKVDDHIEPEVATSKEPGSDEKDIKVDESAVRLVTEEKPTNVLEEKLEVKKPLLPENFLKTCQKNFSDMTREDLEEFCILKIVEGVVDRSNLGEIQTKLRNMSTNLEVYKKKVMMLTKQNRDLQVVLKSIQEEQKRANVPIAPLKITRSVGMQVYMTVAPGRRKVQSPLNSGVNKPVRIAPNQSTRAQKPSQTISQQIPVPRLVPAGSNNTIKSPLTPLTSPLNNVGKASPIPNGVRNSPNSHKQTEKRPISKVQTVDLTDDEPPAKVQMKNSPVQPVRVVPSQNLLAPKPQFPTPVTPRKVYIPISGPQAQSIRAGQTIVCKQMSGHKPRGQLMTPMIRMQQNQVRVRVQSTKHPAPLPDVTKQYQPPSWKALPPAPDLKLSKVENGIVISWKIENYIEENYEEIASYQLYAYQETSSPASTALWKKIGDVKALPLPMACTLTQFMAGYKYYFAVRAVDVKSRLGPFSLPGSILLLNKM